MVQEEAEKSREQVLRPETPSPPKTTTFGATAAIPSAAFRPPPVPGLRRPGRTETCEGKRVCVWETTVALQRFVQVVTRPWSRRREVEGCQLTREGSGGVPRESETKGGIRIESIGTSAPPTLRRRTVATVTGARKEEVRRVEGPDPPEFLFGRLSPVGRSLPWVGSLGV